MPPPPSRNPSLSPYQQFVQEWGNGCGSDLCAKANKICLARGSVPADILCCGEAPGESENIVGKVFVGPAGKLFDRILDASIGVENQSRVTQGKPPLTYVLCNLLGCIPRGDDGLKAGEPSPDDIEYCKPRLEEFIELCDPQLIICVGKLASQYLRPGYKHSVKTPDRETPRVEIMHPSYIIRQNVMSQMGMERKCIVTIASAIEEAFGENS